MFAFVRVRTFAFLHFCIPFQAPRRRAIAAWIVPVVCAIAAIRVTGQQKVTLIGLQPPAVEAKIGAPHEKDVLADSDEVYWTYKTPHGVLSVHFQNGLVVSYSPEDFPLEKIVKPDGT
jgi:hypothetical protein